MFLEIYYFPFILEKSYKIDTILESIKIDLDRFFLYYFNKKIKINKLGKIDDILYFLFIEKNNNNIKIPKLIFQIEGELTENQLTELLEIFSNHGQEKFIINYEGFKIPQNNFLQIDNIDKFLEQAKNIFEKFINEYKKNKVLDETSQTYKKFRKIYSLFLYIHYILLKNYKETKKRKEKLKHIKTNITEYRANINLLKKRLSINEKNLEKSIIIYDQFIEKITKILKTFDN